LENTIAAALNEGNVLVDPIVTVSVVEYRSRPIIVAGAVRNPTTFQAEGQIMLLDAILRAGGIADNAGSEILITHSVTIAGNESAAVTQRVLVRSLLDVNDPDANLKLQAGDIVRVPLAGQVYVVGDVNKPGAFYITGGSDSSVLKVLALSGGLSPFSSHTAYIYRIESGHTERSEIPIKLKKIMDRKSPDATLMANDILYIPDASGRRIGAKALETSLGLSVSAANLAMYATH